MYACPRIFRRFVTFCKIAPYINSLTYLLTYSRKLRVKSAQNFLYMTFVICGCGCGAVPD